MRKIRLAGMGKNVIVLCLTLLLATEGAAFWPSQARAEGQPIRIGLSLGLTGRYADISKLQEMAFRLWERDVNRQGGMLGRPVQVTIYDNASDPEKARAHYESMIMRERMDLLFLPYSSELTEPVLPVTERYRFPVIASGASGDRL